ncbi:MAG TPA: hypothetical protein VF037_09270 [Gemmatimonadales bacterium]
MRALYTSAVVLLALGTAAPLAAQADTAAAPVTMPADSLAHARKLTEWFFTAQFDSLHRWLTPEMRERRTPASLQEDLDQLVSRAGLESEVVEEKFVKRNGQTQYWRTGRYTIFPEPVLFRWAFDKQGRIGGMGLGPASSPPPIDPD